MLYHRILKLCITCSTRSVITHNNYHLFCVRFRWRINHYKHEHERYASTHQTQSYSSMGKLIACTITSRKATESPACSSEINIAGTLPPTTYLQPEIWERGQWRQHDWCILENQLKIYTKKLFRFLLMHLFRLNFLEDFTFRFFLFFPNNCLLKVNWSRERIPRHNHAGLDPLRVRFGFKKKIRSSSEDIAFQLYSLHWLVACTCIQPLPTSALTLWRGQRLDKTNCCAHAD